MIVIRQLLLALAYFGTGWLGLIIPYIGSHITLVWLPTGIAVAALFRWEWEVWPAVYLGAFLVNLSIGSSWLLAASIAIGNTLAPVLSVWWLKRIGFHTTFDRRTDVSSLIIAAGMGMSVSASLGVASLHLAGLIPLQSMAFAWLSWWMGDAVGVLLAAPLLLTLTWKNIKWQVGARREWLLWIMVACLAAWLAFVKDYRQTGHPLPLTFLTLPLFAWAALRFGNMGAALAALFFSLTASWSAAKGLGSFILADAQINLILLWGYMATTILTGLLITALQAERLQMESSLRESEEKLRGLYELSPLGIALTDMFGRYVEFNDAFQNICGYSKEELTTLDYWTLTPKKYQASEARQLESLERTGRYGPYEKEYLRKDGRLIPLRLNGMLITQNDGQKFIWSIVEDITDQKRIEQDLRVAATAFEAQVGIVVTDADGLIMRVNRAFAENTGYSPEELVGKTPRVLKSGRHNEAFYVEMWKTLLYAGVWQGEIWDRRKNGEIYPKWMTITAVKGSEGGTSHYVSTQIDITELKAAEDKIKNLAFFDPLTQLPNRWLLLDRLHQALETGVRSQRQGALLFIDLDNFKTLNDTLGHNKGDMLLQQVAQRLSSCVRKGDTVARFGGDEFVVVLEGLGQNIEEAAAQAKTFGEKILTSLKWPYFLAAGYMYHITPSMGVTLFGPQHQDRDELLKQADLAMYHAKSAGRNTLRFFDPVMQATVTARVVMETDLRNAIRENQIELYYQAQVDSAGCLAGVEVLARWQHPQRGMVPPVVFISLAENTGLILPLGRLMLEAGCAQLASWATSADTARLTLSVNVSIQQLRHPDFVEQLINIVNRTGADPRKLKLELTESVFMDDMESTIAKMTALKAIGVNFALDDFGTGYSSLAYLKRLPLKTLKIDRSFLADVNVESNDAAIVITIVALAQGLGLEIIAEGVETEAQRDFLARNGCNCYQGYLFGRPMPLEEFEKHWFGTHRSLNQDIEAKGYL